MTNVEQLLETKAKITALKEELDSLTAQYDEAKDQVLGELNLKGEHVIETDTATVTVVNMKQVSIQDPKLVITWLKRHNYDPSDFMRLDAIKAKPILSSAIYTQGKEIKGVEASESQTLRVTYKS